VRHCGEITLSGLCLSQKERSQDRAELSFFSQDKFVLFYRLTSSLSRKKVCKPATKLIIEAPRSPPEADSKCKEVISFYCGSLANPGARLVDETCRRAQVVSLWSSRCGVSARWSIFSTLLDTKEKSSVCWEQLFWSLRFKLRIEAYGSRHKAQG